ncbi:MAG: hypothetical protein R3222_00785 [Balneolaceae bacterium]|nr:hypothetical protein [Balneolaceae bacterium]
MLDLSTGNGIIQNEEGDFLVYSSLEIARLDKNGSIIWTVDPLDQVTGYGGLSILEIKQLESGSYAVTGFASKGASTVQYLLIMDGNGVIQSQYDIYTNEYRRGLDMYVNADGFSFAVPVGQGDSKDSLVVLEVSANGVIQNEKGFISNLNDYAITGQTLILEGKAGYLVEFTLKSTNGEEVTNKRLIKLDENLNREWSVDYGGPVFNEIQDINELEAGGYLLVGTYQGKGWALKISNSGNVEWDKKYGSDEPGKRFFFDAEETEMGRIVLTGSNNADGEGYDDLWLLNLDSEGNVIWEVKHGNQYFNFGRSVEYTGERNYVIAGGTQNGFNDPIKMWVLKLNEEGKF